MTSSARGLIALRDADGNFGRGCEEVEVERARESAPDDRTADRAARTTRIARSWPRAAWPAWSSRRPRWRRRSSDRRARWRSGATSWPGGQLFIRSLGAREWPDRTVASRYGFMHALHRNALYQGIAPARRRALHQTIGEREETGHGDRARRHRRRARRAFRASAATTRAPSGTCERPRRRRAGRYANAEAVGYVTRALDIADAATRTANASPSRLAPARAARTRPPLHGRRARRRR